MEFKELIKVLLQNNYKNQKFNQFIDVYYEQPEITISYMWKRMKDNLSLEEFQKLLVLLCKKNIFTKQDSEHLEDSNVLKLNEEKIYMLLFKQSFVDFFLRKKGDIESVIIEYYILNGYQNIDDSVQQIDLYLNQENSMRELIKKSIHDLVQEGYLIQDPYIKLNLQKIYSQLRIEQIKKFFISEINENVALFVETALSLSTLYTKSEYAKLTESIRLDDIKIRLINSNSKIFQSINFDQLVEQISQDCRSYCVIKEDSVNINLINIVQKMKIYLAESQLLKQSPYHLRVFKGICLGVCEVNTMSEKLLIPEKKLKSVLFQLEAMRIIRRHENVNSTISYMESFDDYLDLFKRKLIENSIRLNVRKQVQSQKENEDLDIYLLKQTKFSAALIDLSTKLMILNFF